MELSDSKIDRSHSTMDSITLKQSEDALDAFEIDTLIGEGCSAKVYRVHYKSDCRRVPYALKMLNTRRFSCDKQRQHLNSELCILQQVSHPFIVKFVRAFEGLAYQCMLFEYVSGGDLHDRLQMSNKLAHSEVRFYVAQLLTVLQYLHSKDIVYRDLKPENVLVDKQGFVKLADFGFSKVLPNNARTYTLCGTPEYLSPEFLLKKSEGYGKSVDYWALGVLTYELLVGETPFLADTPIATYKKILKGQVTFPQYIEPSARDFIAKLLNADIQVRTGCNSSVNARAHVFFENICFQSLVSKCIRPPASALRSEQHTSTSMDCNLDSNIEALRFSEIEIKLGFFDCFCL